MKVTFVMYEVSHVSGLSFISVKVYSVMSHFDKTQTGIIVY